MVASGLILLLLIFLLILTPLVALINLFRLKGGRILLGREESFFLSSHRKDLFTVELKRIGRRTDLKFPLLDLSYHVDLAWHHSQGSRIWRHWTSTVPVQGNDGAVLDIDRTRLIRGDYQGRDGFIISDWFGLIRFSLVSSRKLHVQVTAEPGDHAPQFIPSPRAQGVSSFVSLPSEEEMIETRPYYPGDDPRRINWKQYARFGDLFIRTAHQPLPTNKWVLVLLSGETCSLDLLDRGASFFLGLCEVLEGSHCEVYTLVPGQPEIALREYTYLPAAAPGDRLIHPVHSPGQIIFIGIRGTGEAFLWQRQASEQAVPFTLFDTIWAGDSK